jgi:anti-anti-sigma factor
VPAAPALIRVDLGAVTEIDAAGIGVLLRLARTQQERGGDVEIVASSGRVQRLLRAARLNAALHVRGGEPRFDLAIRDLRRQLGARHP